MNYIEEYDENHINGLVIKTTPSFALMTLIHDQPDFQ